MVPGAVTGPWRRKERHGIPSDMVNGARRPVGAKLEAEVSETSLMMSAVESQRSARPMPAQIWKAFSSELHRVDRRSKHKRRGSNRGPRAASGPLEQICPAP